MMRKRCFPVALVCCLALGGCGQKTTQIPPTPEPLPSEIVGVVTPSPTPSEETNVPKPSDSLRPDPQDDPTGYLLSYLDEALAEEKMNLRFWQHPGSGPSSVELSTEDHGEEIRALFSALEWTQTEEPRYETDEEIDNVPLSQPGAYSVSVYYDDWSGYISLGTGNPVITVVKYGADSVCLTAEGAEKLGEKLTDIVPSVYINLGRVRVSPQESEEATIKLYVETAMKRLKENGHITDYVLHVCEPVTFEAESWWEEKEKPAWETHPGIAYTIAYSVKPAHPELAYWQDGIPDLVYWQSGIDEDGWVSVDWGVREEGEGDYYEFLDYDERDGRYGMG